MKKTLTILLALLLCFGLAACAQQPAAAPSASPSSASPSSAPAAPVAEEVKGVTIPNFSVTVNGVTVDQAVVAACPMFSVQATSINSAGTESTVTYVGFAVKDVLAAAGLNEAYIWLEASADDGYKVTINGDTVMASTTLLAMTRDGKPFEKGPWLAPCTSQTTGDYLKGCASILVNTKEGAPDISATPSAAPSEAASSDPSSAGGLPEIQDKTSKVQFAPYAFLVNGKEVTNDTLKDLSIYKITVLVENKNGEMSESTYTGYKLADVLKACGVDSAASVKVKANDGYETELNTELIGSDYTLVAIEKDKATGEGGTIWVAPCSETASKSYCKLVVEITAQ